MTSDELNVFEKEISLVELKTEAQLDFALNKNKSVIYVKADYSGPERLARRNFYQFLKGETLFFREHIFLIDIENVGINFKDNIITLFNLSRKYPTYSKKYCGTDSGTFIFFEKKEIVNYEAATFQMEYEQMVFLIRKHLF